MPLITINDKKVSNLLNDESSIGDVIGMILDDSTNQHETITNIKLDGQEVDQNQNDILVERIGHYNHIDFTTKSTHELASEALDSCKAYIDTTILKINTIARLYGHNSVRMANEQFADLIEVMQLFVQLVTQIQQTIKLHNREYKKSTTIQHLEIHLASVLKALIPAKEKNDIIMLCDLLEYELVDNLKRWKEEAIPEMLRAHR